MKNYLITGLDIGSSAVRLVVGQINPSTGELCLIAGSEVPTMGISKGMVVSIEDVVSSITSSLEQAERIVGQPINHAYVGVSGTHISTMESRGVIAVSRADNEVTESDVARVIEAAQAVATPPNYEILHVIPKFFTVDSQKGIKDPVGMTGIRLEVETKIVQGLSSQIKNLTRAVYRTGIEIDDLVLAILANAEACLTPRQKELGVALVNIGSATTSLAVFEEGDLLATYILPIGSAHITNDIAIGLRVSLELAEEIKLTYGQAMAKDVNKREEINLSEFDLKETGMANASYVAEIIEARMQEIFNLVDKKLMEIERSGLLPAGIVLTGGGAKMLGLIELAKKEFRLPASLGALHGVKTVIEKINDLNYTTAAGLLLWGYQFESQKKHPGGFIKNFNLSSFHDILDKAKNWFKSLIP
ncbi:cell division protein FtsA [Candidatus Kuenenbacteria bacterium CG10_big_fil_rev_8_21_14_0_10_36_11]|uniref:Cell division protein FtsA n=1 Tax=Candidatus Kuenenbacteria bacterium CG10_big_fil_rev_8_21_14_0_10_36_11 TaxID=1974618 RepID=A0A2M6WA26_9BACT|nr:MAG: cell division protein FtsA [Candidatus Kuenenbacteria bacterium CG10_big_fil_rev_8_21_14_0_10_36_11]